MEHQSKSPTPSNLDSRADKGAAAADMEKHNPEQIEQTSNTAATAEKSAPVGIRTILVLLAVMGVYFAQLVGLVGAGSLARQITAAVGGAEEAVWLTSILTLGTIAMGPPLSEMADYFGRKWLLTITTTCGFIGCMITSRGTSIAMVLGGQAVTSISYTAQSILHAIASEVLPRKHRPLAMGAVNIAGALGGATGLLASGALLETNDDESFRTFFYISAGIFAFSALIVGLVYNPPPRPLEREFKALEKLGRFDWIGCVLFTSGVVLFSMALSWSKNPYSWTNAHILAPFLIGLGLIGVMILYEVRIRKDGLFHHTLFASKNFVIAVTIQLAEGVSFFASNNYFSYESEVVLGTSDIDAVLQFAIAFFLYGGFAMVVGVYCSTTKDLRLPMIFGFAAITTFNSVMAALSQDQANNLWGYPVILGLGIGALVPTLVVIAQLSAPPHLIALASALVISSRALGGLIGLSVYTALFNGALTSLGSNLAAAVVPLGVPNSDIEPLAQYLTEGDVGALSSLGISEAATEAATTAFRHTYLLAFQRVWIAAAAFAAAGLIGSLFITNPTAAFTVYIDAPMEAKESDRHLTHKEESSTTLEI